MCYTLAGNVTARLCNKPLIIPHPTILSKCHLYTLHLSHKQAPRWDVETKSYFPTCGICRSWALDIFQIRCFSFSAFWQRNKHPFRHSVVITSFITLEGSLEIFIEHCIVIQQFILMCEWPDGVGAYSVVQSCVSPCWSPACQLPHTGAIMLLPGNINFQHLAGLAWLCDQDAQSCCHDVLSLYKYLSYV